MFYKLLGCTVLTINAAALSAQTVKNTDSLEKQLPGVEIRAVRASVDAPFAKKDISGAALQKQNLGQDLPFLLQYTPSAVVTSDAGAGVGYTGLSIRGTDAARINVTMNGIPVNDPEEQQTFFVDIPDIASSTSSIQIQRGVGTSTNGAGAFGATVSIANISQMDTAGAVLSSSYGSFNTWKNTLLAGTGMLKGGWQFDVRLSKISSDGYIQRSASDLKSLQFIAGWKPSEKTQFHFMVMTGTEKTGQVWDGVPQDSLKTNRTYNELGQKADGTYYNNQTDNYQQDYYQLFADHKFSPYITGHIGLFLTRGIGYYEEYNATDYLSNYGITNAPSDSTALIRQKWLDNYYYGSVFSLMYERNKTQITLGGGITQFENKHYGIIKWTSNGGTPDNYEWYNFQNQKNDFNIYLKAQQRINTKLILFADLQYRNVAYNVGGFEDLPDLKLDLNYSFFNPKAGVTYIIRNTATQHQKVYASFAVANKEPNNADLEVIAPQPEPKAETLYDWELGYELSEKKWNVGATAYYMDYKNQLVLTGQLNDVGDALHTNAAKSYRAGLELQAALLPAKWLKLQGNATFSQNKIKQFTELLYDENYAAYSIDHGTTDIAFSPSVISAVNATFTPFSHLPKGQNLEIGITEKFVGKQYLDNTSDNNRVLDAYNYCNVLLRYNIALHPFREVVASLALNNIFDQKYSNNGATYPYISGGAVYADNYYYPQAGFNVLAGVTLKW